MPLLIKGIGLLVNLTQHRCSDWLAVIQDTSLLVAIARLLEEFSSPARGGMGSSGGVVEQCLCVLLNLSSCTGDIGNSLVHSQDIVRLVSTILVSIVLATGNCLVHNQDYSVSCLDGFAAYTRL